MTRLSSGKRLQYRYIAVMDILGFRDSVQRQPVLEVVRKVAHAFDATKHFECSVSVSPPRGTRRKNWSGSIKHRSALFSDTIIVWTSGITNSIPERDTAIKSSFLQDIAKFIFLSFVNRVPVRVGIAYGECYIHKAANIFVGQPIVDAHLVEKAQEWVGGVLHPTCVPTDVLRHGLASPVVEYQVPVKERFELSLGYALDWTDVPRSHVMARRHGISPEELGYPIYADKMLKQTFAQYAQAPFSESVRQKYRNAETFVHKQMEERALYCMLQDRELLKQIEENTGKQGPLNSLPGV